jgi:hypothetical protein
MSMQRGKLNRGERPSLANKTILADRDKKFVCRGLRANMCA